MTPKSVSGPSLVPPQMYGMPICENATVEDLLLPVGEPREGEVVGEALDLGDLPAVGERPRSSICAAGVRGLGARGGVLRPKLEEVLRRRVVEAQAEQAGDDFGAEAARDLPGRRRALPG